MLLIIIVFPSGIIVKSVCMVSLHQPRKKTSYSNMLFKKNSNSLILQQGNYVLYIWINKTICNFTFCNFISDVTGKIFVYIILQRGLFIFNPSRTIPLEEYNFSGNGSTKKKISCYNIHKNLSGYVRDKIAESKVTGSFIYPDVKNVIALLKNKAVAIFFK